MTRKRFIKQLQGMGLSRNTANHMAEIVLDRGGTYAHGFAYFCMLRDEVERRVREAIKNKILHDYEPLLPYNGLLSFSRPEPEPDPYAFKPVYRIDTKPLDLLPVEGWPVVNPYLADCVVGVDLAQPLPLLNPDAKGDGKTERIILHPNQPGMGGGEE